MSYKEYLLTGNQKDSPETWAAYLQETDDFYQGLKYDESREVYARANYPYRFIDRAWI